MHLEIRITNKPHPAPLSLAVPSFVPAPLIKPSPEETQRYVSISDLLSQSCRGPGIRRRAEAARMLIFNENRSSSVYIVFCAVFCHANGKWRISSMCCFKRTVRWASCGVLSLFFCSLGRDGCLMLQMNRFACVHAYMSRRKTSSTANKYEAILTIQLRWGLPLCTLCISARKSSLSS
ncbi:hypothetical protein P154DRAFT_37105 [Amniculicola lignicola CBS 123094]|uniref:Uncharacterized protein n=1 Tax=Amniculicola lignicola CBS 123094 TaxID=1392246 RepID=A0A6A5WSB4_9PLEO|nr:hypothetical protein P154DRAFT_37105 [Amniculicola lignicola CBS 123094]